MALAHRAAAAARDGREEHARRRAEAAAVGRLPLLGGASRTHVRRRCSVLSDVRRPHEAVGDRDRSQEHHALPREDRRADLRARAVTEPRSAVLEKLGPAAAGGRRRAVADGNIERGERRRVGAARSPKTDRNPLPFATPNQPREAPNAVTAATGRVSCRRSMRGEEACFTYALTYAHPNTSLSISRTTSSFRTPKTT